MGEPFRGGVGAVSSGKGIIDIDVAVLGEFCGKVGVVLFLALVEAGIFQKQDIAIIQGGNGPFGRLSNAVFAERDRLVQHFLDGGNDL